MSLPPTSTSTPTPSTSTSTCGMTRRLSLLKKFGSSLVRSSVSSPRVVMGEHQGNVSGGRLTKVPDHRGEDSKENEERKIMPPPQPPPSAPSAPKSPVTTPKKHLPSTIMISPAGSGSNMRKLLEELHRSRMSFERDQKELDRTRYNIRETDAKVSKLQTESNKAKEKFKMLAEKVAFKRTELNALEIKNKVVDKTLQAVEEELNQVLDELHQIRIQNAELSSSYLDEAVEFGLNWNGTDLGCESRKQFNQQELDNLERQKRQLEFELADFLVLKKGVEESEKDVEVLSQRYKEHDEDSNKQESDLQKRIEELDVTLKELEEEESEFQRTSFEEMNQLQKQIDEIQTSINSLQSQSAEAKATVKTQKNSKTPVPESAHESHFQQQSTTGVPVSDDMTSKLDSSMTQNQNSSEMKARLTRFQVPVKPQLQLHGNASSVNISSDPSKENYTNSSYFSNNDFDGSFPDNGSNSNSNDEEMCLMAAEDASQTLRAYEPVAATPKNTQPGPPPTKVRVVERQTPITAFMKQLSSAKVIKRPGKNAASQGIKEQIKNFGKPFVQPVAPVRSTVTSGKTFQFKRKSSGGVTQVDIDKENASHASGSDECMFKKAEQCRRESGVPELFDDLPFSRFTSSRALLTESQRQRLDEDNHQFF